MGRLVELYDAEKRLEKEHTEAEEALNAFVKGRVKNDYGTTFRDGIRFFTASVDREGCHVYIHEVETQEVKEGSDVVPPEA